MCYRVKLTSKAYFQIEETKCYISEILHENLTAKKWLNDIYAELESLRFMPARYPIAFNKLNDLSYIRRISIKNFSVYYTILYYTIGNTTKIVWVLSVLYGRREQFDHLCNISLDDLK